MPERGNTIGEFLRARRELIEPADVGLREGGGRRRVPGLRRAEVAMRAGISAEYYVRLEQGRDQHPSSQVVDALARALQLDDDATAHLHRLSVAIPARTRTGEAERVPGSIEQLIASWPLTPAFVQGRLMDVLAANTLASALSPAFRPGVNLVRAVFLDPDLRTLVSDWETVAQSAVARLRALAGPDVDDPRLADLVGELSVRSEEFRRLWARHDVEIIGVQGRVFNHPLVGAFGLHIERLTIAGTDGQTLIVHHADPGSPSERALQRLRELKPS